MATLIQSDSLSQVPGTAGGQRPVQDQSPIPGTALSNFVETASNLYDTAGTVYSKNRADSLVREELENIDSAVSLAEKKALDEDFVVDYDSLPVSQDEFSLIENAVKSGAMSREKARLIASSRLRTRISEQPLFADKLRKAASNVVGFNIESESARQYFGAFPTQGQIAGSQGNSYRDKLWEEAQAKAPALDVSTEEYYKHLVEVEAAEDRKKLIMAKKDLQAVDNFEAFTEMNQENSRIRFGNILGALKESANSEGGLKEERAAQILAQAKAAEMQELQDTWDGDQTSAEFQRARTVIEDGYSDLQDFVDAVGFDTLQQIKIDRAKRARTILGDELMGNIKLIRENMGGEIASQAMDLFANITDPARLETLLKSNPALGNAGVLLGNPTAVKKFGDQVADVYRRVSLGEPVESGGTSGNAGGSGASNEATLDFVLGEMFQAGPEGETQALEYMKQQGMQVKPVSMITQKSPGRASEDSRKYFKTMYNNTMPQVSGDLASVLAENPDLEWTITDQGLIEITEPEPVVTQGGGTSTMRSDIRRTQRAQAAFDQAADLAQHINLYGEGIQRGWGNIVDKNPTLHRNNLSETLDKAFTEKAGRMQVEAQMLVLDGDTEAAREQFGLLQRLSPQARNWTFDKFVEAVRRKNVGEAGTSGE